MSSADYISRIQPDPDGLDFDALRREGIALLQDLCGKTWTDYNLHDPGITILEQLCYGLTDLAYRSGFDPEDYLTEQNGRIDYEAQALYPPQEIFPSQPLTANDYRKIIYDAVPALDDIWFAPASGDGVLPRGLFAVFVKLDEALDDPASAGARDHAIRKVKEVFAAHRNLCEDIHEVKVVETEHYLLKGEIEIAGHCDPAEVLAAIHFECARYISSGFEVDRYEDVFAGGTGLEQIFTGPLTRHGYIGDGNFASPHKTVSIVKLIGLIRDIEGVMQVHRLGLVNTNGQSVDSIAYDPVRHICPRLRFPGNVNENLLHLFFARGTAGSPAADREEAFARTEKESSLLKEARLQLAKRKFEFQAFRNSRQTMAQFVSLPQGTHRNLHDYYSIQNQFPAIYGINKYGVPMSAPAERKASAAQLKAYLFMPEQLMANYLQTLQEIPRLFSVSEPFQQSYFSQRLDNRSLPGIERLYVEAPDKTAAAVAEIQSGYDDVDDRRNRILDFMLAIYGEQFSQKSLQRFNYYQEKSTPEWMIRNKLVFLKNIVSLGRNRATAFDYSQPVWNTGNVAGLQKKVSVLLGLKHIDSVRSLSGVLADRKIRLLPDDIFEQSAKTRPADENGHPVPRKSDILPDPAATSDFLKDVPLGESAFRKGFDLKHYVLIEDGQQTLVCFRRHQDATLWQFASAVSRQAAQRCAHEFCRTIAQLNADCEGLHIVEHLLLRPRGDSKAAHEKIRKHEGFFEFRISVIFPAWTARFHDREFRKLAEETVCSNAPAHVYPEFYWLDFVRMRDFEARYQTWLQEMRAFQSDAQALDAAADGLIAFLQKNENKNGRDYWV